MDNLTIVNSEESPEDKSNRILQVYVLFTLVCFGYLGNISIIIVLCRQRIQRRCFTNINFLILQLAVSDLLVVSFCLFADAIWKSTYCWLAGDFMCRFVKFMQMFSLYASTFIIVTISLDRCIAIVWPMPKFDQHRIIKKFIFTTWILAAICSTPQVEYFSVNLTFSAAVIICCISRYCVQKAPFAINNIEGFYQCVTHGAYTAEWQEPAYIVFTFCVMFAFPLLIIIHNYVLIWVRITRESRLGQTSVMTVASCQADHDHEHPNPNPAGSFSTGHRREVMRKAKWKALYISVIVIATFVICWTPYYVLMIYYVIVSKDPADSSAHNMFQIIFFFGMSNSVFNPLVYGAFHMAQRSQEMWQKWFNRTRNNSSTMAHSGCSLHWEHNVLIKSDIKLGSSPRRISSLKQSFKMSSKNNHQQYPSMRISACTLPNNAAVL